MNIQERFSKLWKKTPDEIAELLRTNGIKGIRRSSRSCPIAQYLRGDSDKVYVTVGLGIISVESYGGGYISTMTPTNVGMFINYFDHGSYPDLVQQ